MANIAPQQAELTMNPPREVLLQKIWGMQQ